jgi:hypothetical protein
VEATRRRLAGAGGEIRIGEERGGGPIAGSGLARAVAGGTRAPLRLLIVFSARGP